MTNYTKKRAVLDAKLEALARDYVNLYIEQGDMMTADMRDQRDAVSKSFSDFMTRDIRTFGETGKYPQYA